MYSIAEILSKELQRKIEYVNITEDEYRINLQFEGWHETSINESIKLCQFVKQGWNSEITDGILDILGKEPYTFKDYAHDHVDYWKEMVVS